MPFKVNISHKEKTYKVETENEALVQLKIGDTFSGSLINPDLEGYELEITGTSDISGFPGIKGQPGSQLRGVLLTKADKGMNNKQRGLRLRKTVRGEELSEKTVQINTKVLKEGAKPFASLFAAAPAEAEKPPEEKEKPAAEEKPAKEVKEEKKPPEEAGKPEEEPKATEEEKAEESEPEEEPKASEPKKEELAKPEEEPK